MVFRVQTLCIFFRNTSGPHRLIAGAATSSSFRNRGFWHTPPGPRSLDVAFDEVFVVLLTGIFQDFPIRPETKRPHIRPGLAEYLRVSDGDFICDVPVIRAREPLNNAQLIAMRMADRIEILLE